MLNSVRCYHQKYKLDIFHLHLSRLSNSVVHFVGCFIFDALFGYLVKAVCAAWGESLKMDELRLLGFYVRIAILKTIDVH